MSTAFVGTEFAEQEHQKLGKHDLEMFNDELEVYGLWRNALRHTARAFSQLSLSQADD